jgi:hypothetical protein
VMLLEHINECYCKGFCGDIQAVIAYFVKAHHLPLSYFLLLAITIVLAPSLKYRLTNCWRWATGTRARASTQRWISGPRS